MVSSIRQIFFDRHYKKLLSKETEVTRTSSVNTLSTVTLLVSGEYHRASDLRAAKKYLQQQNITAHPYLVDDTNKGIDDEGVSLISRADCTWYGIPSQELIINWLSNKTDLLIAANPSDAPLMRYLTASSNSRLKTSLDYETTQDPTIDLYITTKAPFDLSLKDQCKLILDTLKLIGKHS